MLDYSLDFNLPYITKDLPGIGGSLRAVPDDFVVEEIPLYEAQGEGQHLYVNLTKVGYTTKEVQAQLERLFRLKRGEVSFAGMKDKAARTTQTFSLNVGFQSEPFADEAMARIAAELPVEVHWAKFHRNKLRPGHLLGNRFTITVTDLPGDVSSATVQAEAIVAQMRQSGLPNYFGPQRFGSSGTNVRQGLEVLRGEGGRKSRWLRRFLISAYQSYLCNRYLAQRVEMGAFDRLLLGDVAKKYATGGMFQVENLAEEQPRYTAHEISFTAPMYGSKMWAAQDESGELEAALLADAPAGIAELGAARVEGTRRLGRLLLPDCEVATSASGEGVVIRFSLPKGAFATTVLREIMKVDTAALAAVDGDDGDE